MRFGAYDLVKASLMASNLLDLEYKSWKKAKRAPSISLDPSAAVIQLKDKLFHKMAPLMFAPMKSEIPLPSPYPC
jgi:hypothetical protein